MLAAHDKRIHKVVAAGAGLMPATRFDHEKSTRYSRR
jgi:hypothetical protein